MGRQQGAARIEVVPYSSDWPSRFDLVARDLGVVLRAPR